MICKNCDFEFKGKYCSNCSQSAKANFRLTFKSIIGDFLDTVFNLDKGFIYTFWNLLKQPGFVTRSFINGKRKNFTNPTKYIILATAIQALGEYLFMFEEQGVPFTKFFFLSSELNENMHLWNETMTLNYPILFGIINLIVWPIPLYFLFKKLKNNIPELIAAMMYFYGTIVILIQVMSLIHAPTTGKNLPIELVSLLGTVYMLYALLSFYKRGSISWRIPRIIIAMLFLIVYRMFILPFALAYFFPLASS
ncbi:DUF3667 domain-containing protein [Hyunsoonleella aestuarii]|uniref:DUF3667 domain-containing protein n=1 Tax=Hyunsoonleella aestuarii TaxID=912802 RepID=A0ABP8ECL9_9FLAO|nr:DUF3667 domain-containing protein [Hyunsoonleella aestuarii]